MIKRLLSVGLLIVAVMSLAGCFTGVESTPKITLDDVKREKVTYSAEQAFLADVAGQPFASWTAGKEFYVTDNKINLIFGATVTAQDSLAGKILTYERGNVVTSMLGDSVVELVFANSGREYVYRTGATLAELNQRKSVDVPFAIEMSMVNDVRQLVTGLKCYVLTSVWYDGNDGVTYQRKYVPVTITDAQPGNHVYPVKLAFDDDCGGRYHMFLNMSESVKAPRSFATQFSFKDPHLRYSDIDDDVWENIVNGRVELGMTRDECRLSLGAPTSIDRQPGYNGVGELWLYDNGTYLRFHDALLQDFRVASARK
ncbi:MAG: hypothetical protein IKZ14_04030 [Muribaculaceae bacterium]|nr:hypothetical protein [Muribaculaceae bacterium]